tara:strand:+ start:3634 stop:3864 length:231 start_codon:yes stop_codon:yes gene_type:complete
MSDDDWQIQKYRIKLRHDLRLALLKQRYDFRAKLKNEFWLEYYFNLVDTRRDLQSEDEKSRDELEERLLLKGMYDG